MKKLLSTTLLLLMLVPAFAKPPKNQYVRIKTSYGECIIRLYNETPKHRDNFIKLTKSGFYNGTLFHRVIQGFMIQGGDPKSKKSAAGEPLGGGDVGYKIPAEFKDSLFHKSAIIILKKLPAAASFILLRGKDLPMQKWIAWNKPV
jgi:cyclophilin family peptidyl-prolyl cis-trans isomerase